MCAVIVSILFREQLYIVNTIKAGGNDRDETIVEHRHPGTLNSWCRNMSVSNCERWRISDACRIALRVGHR
jgi:hypothetical protein